MVKVLIALFSIFIVGCSSSLVYSPSANISNKPLKKEEVDIQGSLEALPETRPEVVGEKTTIGVAGQIGYGFTDKFNLYSKVWMETDEIDDFRGGFSFTGQYQIEINASSRWIILPRFGFVLDQNNFEGGGVGGSLIYHNQITEELALYAGPGVIWGTRHFGTDETRNQEMRMPMGFGIIANAGVAWEFIPNLRLNFEVNPIYQINTFDENSTFIAAPSIGFGYTFR